MAWTKIKWRDSALPLSGATQMSHEITDNTLFIDADNANGQLVGCLCYARWDAPKPPTKTDIQNLMQLARIRYGIQD